MNKTIIVETMNEFAIEAKLFNGDRINFLQDGLSLNNPKIFEQVKKHLSFLRGMFNHLHHTIFSIKIKLFIVDDFHRNIFEQWRVNRNGDNEEIN